MLLKVHVFWLYIGWHYGKVALALNGIDIEYRGK